MELGGSTSSATTAGAAGGGASVPDVPASEPGTLLPLATFERYQALDGSDPTAFWSALQDLVPHLEDHLVSVDCVELGHSRPCRLAVFRARDTARTPCYVHVAQSGTVTVGRLDELKQWHQTRLSDFDPIWHEAVSVVVSEQGRFVGDRLDLLIVVQRSTPDPDEDVVRVVYHGLVWIDRNGRPRVASARDDGMWADMGDDGEWPVGPAERLPALFSRWPVSGVRQDQPLVELPPKVSAAIEETQRQAGADAVAVACAERAVGWAVGEEIALLRLCKEEPRTHHLLDPATCLAVAPEAVAPEADPEGDGWYPVVVGCDAYELLAFKVRAEKCEKDWRQRIHDLPTALVFLPEGQKTEGKARPDLLIATIDGRLERLRLVGNESIRRLWKSCWQKLGLESSEQRLDAARRAVEKRKPYRAAALVGAVEQILGDARDLTPVERQGWRDRASKLFDPQEPAWILWPALDCLLKALRRFAEDPEGEARPMPDSNDFLPALLEHVYSRRVSLKLREQVDQAVRRIFPNASNDENEDDPKTYQRCDLAQNDENLRKLLNSTYRSRVDIRRETPRNPFDQIEQASIAVEQWASPNLHADTVLLGNDRHLAALAVLQRPTECWLALAQWHQLRVLRITKNSKIELKGGRSKYLGDILCGLAAVPGNDGDRLLALCRSGTLHLFRWNPSSHIEEILDFDWSGLGRAFALATCPASSGQDTLGAVLLGRERRSHVILLRIGKERVEPLSPTALDLPRTRTLDLCTDGADGYWLAVGTDRAVPPRFYHLDAHGKILKKRWFRPLTCGTSAVRFTAAAMPALVVAGEPGGLLWCADPRDEGLGDLRWTYQLRGAVRSIERLGVGGEPHVLVGSESGTLVLLRVTDGRRIWKGWMGQPIRHVLAPSDASRIVVGMRNGWLQVLEQTAGRENSGALRKAERKCLDLRKECAPEDPAWKVTDADSVNAFLDWHSREFPLADLFQKYRSRETRARLLRRLAVAYEEDPGCIDTEEAAAIVSRLSFQDLGRFLAYLPRKAPLWERTIEVELRNRQPHDLKPEDDPPWSAHAVMVTWLQRLGQSKPSVDALHDHWPPKSYQSSPWVQIELARLLVQAVERECRQTERRDEIFPCLLLGFFRFSPDLIDTAASVVPYGSLYEKKLRLTSRLLNELASSSWQRAEDLTAFEESLAPLATDDHPLSVLAALIKLHRCLVEHHGTSWPAWREDGLNTLQRLLERSYRFHTAEAFPLDRIVMGLHALLDRQPIPDNYTALKERFGWFERARHRLEQTEITGQEDSTHPWHPARVQLIVRTREAILQLVRFEGAYLLQLVRPRLRLLSAHCNEYNRVQLLLEHVPEGSRHLNDVTIKISTMGKDGLRPIGKNELLFHHEIYPERFKPQSIEFNGFAHPEQGNICVQVRLEDGSGYVHEESWIFPITRPANQSGGRWTFPSSLSQAYKRFCAAAMDSRHPVILAVLDADLGAELFLTDWQARFQGNVFDLDAAIRDYGKGSRYSERRLDADLIEEKLDEAVGRFFPYSTGDTSIKEVSPLLIAPSGETLQRMLEESGRSTVSRWVAALRQRAEKGLPPRLVLLVSSAHACLLRGLGLGQIREVAAHQLSFSPSRRVAITEQKQTEAWRLVESETPLPPEILLTELGEDLRLVLRWLRWSHDRPGGESRSLDNFLQQESIEESLRAELASLDSFQLICALVGSEAQTCLERDKVRPGHVLATKYNLTVQSDGSAQHVVDPGTELSDDILSRLTSLSRLELQGFAVATSASSAERTRLLEVVWGRPREIREPAIQCLVKLRLGSWMQGVFRTAPPYRGFIQRLYDRFPAMSAERRDVEVYSAIMGKDHSLAEVIPPSDLASIPDEQLAQLMPTAKHDDLRCLRHLVELWCEDPGKEEKIASLLGQIFHSEPVTQLRADPKRWDFPVTSLNFPIFGVGKISGPDPGTTDPNHFVLWVRQPVPDLVRTLGKAIDDATELREARLRDSGREPSFRSGLRVYLMGPGIDAQEPDPRRHLARLRLIDACHAAAEGDLVSGLHRRARLQMRLTAFSPFQTAGALPPGSRLFVGREDELEFIKGRIRKASLLIVGGRRVGKTSLLNQVEYWARHSADLEPIAVDLQSVASRDAFVTALRDEAESPHLHRRTRVALRQASDDARSALRSIAHAVRNVGRLAIFLFNEVDLLAERDLDLITIWRGLNDEGLARFIMVGYSVISRLVHPESPFFHFTEGNRLGGKAISLAELSRPAAEKLLELLTESGLDLRWSSRDERTKAHAWLLDRSYRIPWVLQRYGQLLVEHLEQERRAESRLADVQRVLDAEGQVVWQYIDGIDYQSLDAQSADPALRPGYQLVLFSMARHLYFFGDAEAPIKDSKLRERRPLDLSFSVGEAREVVKGTIRELLLPRERKVVEEWFDQLDLDQTLRLLTLTLTLEPHPKDADRYAFLLHIVPLELHRIHGATDPTLDSLIVEKAVEFYRRFNPGNQEYLENEKE